MSNRDTCMALLNDFTEEQLVSIATMLNSVKQLADNSADDAYCLRLSEDYHASMDKGDSVDIESFAHSLGVSL